MSTELALALHRIGSPRLLVVGDYIYDSEYYAEAVRFAQESPTCPVWKETASPVFRAGGAGAVCKMAEALGAQVELIAPITGAASKIRFFVNGIQSMRFDSDARKLSADELGRLAAHVADEVQRADCVLIADYGKGVCTNAVLRAAINGAKASSVPCIVDPAHGADWKRYVGATCIKCNYPEFDTTMNGPVPLGITKSCGWWEHVTDNLVVTHGAAGLTHYPRRKDAVEFGCRHRRAIDPTGCGDMVLAALGVCIAGSYIGPCRCGNSGEPWCRTCNPDCMSWPNACKFANAAAGLKVERRGAVPVPRCEVIADLLTGIKIIPDELLPAVAEGARSRGWPVSLSPLLPLAKMPRRVVWTNGCMDGHGLHRGHLHSLMEAKKQGDVLIVGVNGDRSVAALKGAGRPLSAIADRLNAVAALACVDYVVEVQDDEHLLKCLKAVAPDVLVKGDDWRGKDIIGADFAGRVHFVERLPDYSTTGFA